MMKNGMARIDFSASGGLVKIRDSQSDVGSADDSTARDVPDFSDSLPDIRAFSNRLEIEEERKQLHRVVHNHDASFSDFVVCVPVFPCIDVIVLQYPLGNRIPDKRGA